MNIFKAITRVDKSPKNETWCDPDEFCTEFGLDIYFDKNGYDKFAERVKGYYLTKWMCTDTWVGHIVYFLDSEPVAISYQPARKSEKCFTFVDSESANKLINFILSLLENNERNSVEILKHDDEIDDFYSVNFTGQLLTNEGFVDNRHCVIINNFEEDYIAKRAIVKFDDGEEKEINICDFKIPICIKWKL